MSSLQQIRFFESIALKSNLSGRFQHKNEDMKGSFRLAATSNSSNYFQQAS